ncbi:MAG: cyclodeaminase/cyclohydrolase family protein [Candidatus Thermoplasmatota archaeon]|nr:cyclodeaminase/cyclohydrolase family protein [Candidatus Thermoplasmatota archaeon]
MLSEKSVKDFLAELSSESPAPGGGSVAALAGALAAGLNSMVANLTIGKDKYAMSQDMMIAVRGRSGVLRGKLVQLVDDDTAAFNKVMDAFKMPKETEEQKKARSDAIQAATKKAAEIPLEVCKISNEILKLTKVVAERGNQNSITDAGAAALMADAAIQIAALNVKINLSSIKDEAFVEDMSKKLSEIEFSAVDAVDETMQLVLAVVDPDALAGDGDEELGGDVEEE